MGIKTWEEVDSDRNLVESQGGNNLYLNQGKAGRYVKQGMDSRNHRKRSLTNWYVGEKVTAVSAMTPDFGRPGDGGDTTQGRKQMNKRKVFLFFRKGKFNLEHFELEHLRVPSAVRSMIETCLVTMSKGWSSAS